MMKKKKEKARKHTSRKWLNKRKNRTALVVTHLEASSYEKGREHPNIYAYVELKDCTRSITLDFDCYSKKELKEATGKIDLLLNELVTFREKLLEFAKPYEKPIKKPKSKKPKPCKACDEALEEWWESVD